MLRLRPMHLWSITQQLNAALTQLQFAPPTDCVYNPLTYAAAPLRAYLERFGSGPKEVLLLGMNPGPYGMVQTGVPFGAVPHVRDWMGIEAPVQQPPRVHPKRPIAGFACRRVEVSGERLWGWVGRHFGAPQAFFKRFFVYNYCPLAFMEASGKNRLPEALFKQERLALYAACDQALRQVVEALQPRVVVGIGAFAQLRAQAALPCAPPIIGRILHPSPQSPLANRGWAPIIEAQLQQLGVAL